MIEILRREKPISQTKRGKKAWLRREQGLNEKK